MKEKELRLAAVFYGGVSLAIYQHGINKEILNLLRASKAYHAPATLKERQAKAHTFRDALGDGGGELATAEVYFDLLKEIGQTLDLRIILDVISGSSAGAINGLVLARAVAHDLSLDPLTSLWLEEADITRLLAPEARARMWSKWYLWPFLTPVIAGLRREGLLPALVDAEMRRALSTFFRSRWFNPPLDGRKLTTLLLDGLRAMGQQAPNHSLLPMGQRLDLVITVTDYHGAERLIPAHDPPVVLEIEHRHLLHFSRRPLSTGAVHSDFGLENLPGLAFAGRASASFPGAFPPAQLSEIDELVERHGLTWPMRAQFLKTHFDHYRDEGRQPESAVLMDGSILNNKPIAAAVDLIRTHPAYREVDRRLVYIDPHPSSRRGLAATRVPGFFSTLRGALSTLPRNQPIYDEISEIARDNEQLHRLRDTMAAVRPQVRTLVDKATGGRIEEVFTPDQLTRWRLDSANLLGRMPLVQSAWFRAMLLEAVTFVAALISKLCGYRPESARAMWVRRIMESWSQQSGIFSDSYRISRRISHDKDLPPFAAFLVNFDIGYKRRRLTIVIQTLNGLYGALGEPGSDGTTSAALDRLKKKLYHCVSLLTLYEDVEFIGARTAAAARDLFGEESGHRLLAGSLSVDDRARISSLVGMLSDECSMVSVNQKSDEALSSPVFFEIGPACRADILTSYLGFVYWDAMLYPITGALNVSAGGITEVLIDRISPQDSMGFHVDDPARALQGGAFLGFAGFLSRAVRENDYLWGRLHAVDRLLDIVASSAAAGQGAAPLDIGPFKIRAFKAVLASETGKLKYSQKLIDRLQAQLEKTASGTSA